MPHLSLRLRDDDNQERVELRPRTALLFGREPDAERLDARLRAQLDGFPVQTVRLPFPRVSANHLLVTCTEGEVRAWDLFSKNGTWVRVLPGHPLTLPSGADLSFELTAPTRSTQRMAAPLDAQWTSERGFSEAVRDAVVAWLGQTGLHARVSIGSGQRDAMAENLPLADGGQLLVAPPREGTVELPWLAVVERIRAYVNEQNIRYEQTQGHDDDFILVAPALRAAHQELVDAAAYGMRLMLLGPTGAGKDRLARCYHRHSRQHRGPYATVNCAMLRESLLYAQLFGAKKGSFTGAVTDLVGVIESAHEGTLFLDEIGNLPLDAQRMLLLVLQDGRVTRIGESTPRPVSVKVLAATNLDLSAAVRAGRFRADLYARLNPAARLLLPPLRERLVDLEPLLRGLLRKTFAAGPNRALLCAYQDAARLGGPPQVELLIARGAAAPARGVRFVLAPASMQALRGHPWPGNVRELEWLIGNAAVFALADALRAAEAGRAPSGTQGTVPIPAKLVRELLGRSAYDLVGAPPPAPVAAGPNAHATANTAVTSAAAAAPGIRPARALRDVAQELERALYERLYAETGGDFAAMARQLLVDTGARERDARRVRLRYNQLGLRVRRRR